jgi:hypothetical protein
MRLVDLLKPPPGKPRSSVRPVCVVKFSHVTIGS